MESKIKAIHNELVKTLGSASIDGLGEQYDHGGYIKALGHSFFIRLTSGKNGKGEVHTNFKRGLNNYWAQPEINPTIGFNPDKDAKTIASDIVRRFWPDYIKACSEVNVRIKDSDAYHTAKRDRLVAIAKICKLQYYDKQTDRITYDTSEISGYLGSKEKHYVKVRGNRDNAELTIDGLSTEQIAKIVEVLK